MRAVPKIYKNFGIPLPLAIRLREVAEQYRKSETSIILQAVEKEVKRVEELLMEEVITK